MLLPATPALWSHWEKTPTEKKIAVGILKISQRGSQKPGHFLLSAAERLERKLGSPGAGAKPLAAQTPPPAPLLSWQNSEAEISRPGRRTAHINFPSIAPLLESHGQIREYFSLEAGEGSWRGCLEKSAPPLEVTWPALEWAVGWGWDLCSSKWKLLGA